MNLSTITLSMLLLVSAPVAAQDPAPQLAPVTQSPLYRIGLEDEIRLFVVGEDGFNNIYRLQADGTITVPLIGNVTAQGHTPVELQARIRSALVEKQYLRDPQVRVEISKYGSQYVLVQGEVRNPSRIAMSGSMTLLEALAAAGSQTANAGTTVTIARRTPGAAPGTAPGDAPRDAETIIVNLTELGRGIVGADRPLMGGDIVTVSKAETFYVSGEVRNVGVQNWEPGLTVNKAITKAGGITEKGRDSGIKVRRLVDGKPKEFEVKLTDPVQPNDEIQIQKRRL